MKVDAEIFAESPAEASALAKKAEEFGFECLWVNETKHDPFVQLALAAEHTQKIALGTSIALAFTRSPTTLAYTAWDLQNLSKGRLILGLGSQVKGHIERRFGMEWGSPAPRMKEYVLALRAVWDAWQNGGKLDFRGRFYGLSLMPPFFSPGPIEHPTVPVFVAGVNAGMCRVVGQVGDGLHVHPLHTVRYLKEVMMPSLVEALARSRRRREDISVAASVFAAVGDTESEVGSLKEAYRKQVAFYASTRTYRRILETHGWADVSERLHKLSVSGEWDRMAGEVSDDMLGEFVVEGRWEEMGRIMDRRYGGAVDRVRLYLPFDGQDKWRTLVAGFRA